jgi:hypothetical protein
MSKGTFETGTGQNWPKLAGTGRNWPELAETGETGNVAQFWGRNWDSWAGTGTIGYLMLWCLFYASPEHYDVEFDVHSWQKSVWTTVRPELARTGFGPSSGARTGIPRPELAKLEHLRIYVTMTVTACVPEFGDLGNVSHMWQMSRWDQNWPKLGEAGIQASSGGRTGVSGQNWDSGWECVELPMAGTNASHGCLRYLR